MADRISVRGVQAKGFHGVLPEEREAGQVFVVDVDLHVDMRAAARSDSLADTVDYSAIAAAVVEILAGEPVALIETLAQRIADMCLSHNGVGAVDVAVHKPEAPVGVPFTDVAVTISRNRP